MDSSKLTQKEAAALVKEGKMTESEFKSRFQGRYKGEISKLRRLFNSLPLTGTKNDRQVDAGLANRILNSKAQTVVRSKKDQE